MALLRMYLLTLYAACGDFIIFYFTIIELYCYRLGLLHVTIHASQLCECFNTVLLKVKCRQSSMIYYLH